MSARYPGRRAPSPPLPFPGSQPDTTDWAWPWNPPRAAILVDKTPAVDLVELGQQQAFFDQLKQALRPLPLFIRHRLSARINSVYRLKGRPVAQLALRDIIRRELPHIQKVTRQYALPAEPELQAWQNLNSLYHNFRQLHTLSQRFNQLPDHGDDEVELLAQDIAIYMTSVLSEVNVDIAALDEQRSALWLYREASCLTRYFRQTPPGAAKRRLRIDEQASAISKMLDARYWQRLLRKYAARWREHLHIASGDVRRGVAPYCSKHQLMEWEARRKRSRAIMSQLELEEVETGERLSLLQQVDNSISSPEKRRIELMTRIGGFEKVAVDNGFVGNFFTLTAPSKYHPWSIFGHRNSRWNGASPRETQRYLNRLWQQIRAGLARRSVAVFGLRVAESHHDGTPHWHGLLFTAPEDVEALREVMEAYATREDAGELQGRHGTQPRFEMKAIDASLGSATGYVVKYIAKNIDGYALDNESDNETGRPLKETALHATAWASCWGIRQFQFLGGAPVTVWRELRRLRDQPLADAINPLFGELHRAADAGDWQQYIQLQGGALVARRDLVLRPWYQPQAEPNRYGEYHQRISGLVMPALAMAPVTTRTHRYRIVRMAPGSGQAVDLQGASAPAWTCVNNCTLHKKQTQPHAGAPPPQQLEIAPLTVISRQILKSESPAPATSPQRPACDPATEALARQVLAWARLKRIALSQVQALGLARGETVATLDRYWRAHPVTGELTMVGVDKHWRKTLAAHQTARLISRWQATVK